MPQLRVVRSTSEQITIPRYLVVETAMEATALADELTTAISAVEQRLWAGNRAGAIDQLNRAAHRIEQMRMAITELAGIADRAPTEPGAALSAA